MFDKTPSVNCATASSSGVSAYTRDVCPYVQQCSPMSACVGNNLCDSGYAGSLCSTCDTGMSHTHFHQLQSSCKRQF